MATAASDHSRQRGSKARQGADIPSKTSHGTGAQAVERALTILVTFVAKPQQTLASIAQDLELPKSTTHRLVTALTRFDLLEQGMRYGSYRLGPQAAGLASQASRHRATQQPIHDALEFVWQEVGETVGASILRGGWAIVIDKIHAPHSLMYRSYIGDARRPHASAAGKVLLAGLSRSERRKALGSDSLTACTSQTITSIDRLETHLALVRSRGYAVDDEESTVGLRCVAVPVHDESGGIAFSLGASGPTSRVSQERVEEIAESLKRGAARAVVGLLGSSD